MLVSSHLSVMHHHWITFSWKLLGYFDVKYKINILSLTLTFFSPIIFRILMPWKALREPLEGQMTSTLDTSDLGNLKAPRRDRSKVNHLSESSNDSGFAYKNGLSSNSSAGSSYAGSPTGSSHGIDSHTNLNHHSHSVRGGLVSSRNGSTSGNGTEYDPQGSHSIAQQQVAHNHTYNTPPGQVPREVNN